MSEISLYNVKNENLIGVRSVCTNVITKIKDTTSYESDTITFFLWIFLLSNMNTNSQAQPHPSPNYRFKHAYMCICVIANFKFFTLIFNKLSHFCNSDTTIDDICARHPSLIIMSKTECHRYYNCSGEDTDVSRWIDYALWPSN